MPRGKQRIKMRKQIKENMITIKDRQREFYKNILRLSGKRKSNKNQYQK